MEIEINRFITIDDIVDTIKQYADDFNHLPSSHKLVINAKKCRSNIRLKDLAKLNEVNTLLSEKFDLLKVAVLLNDPMYTAICMVYQQLIKSNHYFIQVFSTHGAAHRWLGKDVYGGEAY
ncbi:hypothetical protein ACT29I_03505 [Saccharicrinis sp. GN24d3]|uniref:hypothetical protein n=1 Tax=Saccharicrinis sp. 156 TaxID=3417574 RepID=UPI003D34DFA7